MLTDDTGVVCTLLQSSCSAYNAYVTKLCIRIIRNRRRTNVHHIQNKGKLSIDVDNE